MPRQILMRLVWLAAVAGLGLTACGNEELSYIPPPEVEPEVGTLKGRLCDRQNGLWVAFATVTLDDGEEEPATSVLDGDEEEPATSVVSDADGNFIFEDLAPGEYVMTIESETYSGRRSGVVKVDQVTDIGVTECIPDAGHIRGRVCDAAGEVWLALATVSVILDTGTISTSTDEEGWFLLENVPVGSQTVYVTGSGVETRTVAVEVRIFDTVTVGDAACGPVGGVIGRICAPDGTWLAQAEVYLEDGGEVVASTITDAEGRFILTDVPSGSVTLTVRRGSFSTFINVDIPSGQVVELPEPVCIPPTTNMAVVTGSYDSIEHVLEGLGHQIRHVYTASGQATQNAEGNVDIIDGMDFYWLDTFLADDLWLNEYDIVLFNCGLDDWALTDASNASVGIANLTNFVSSGRSIYASDWAAEVVRVAFPGRVNFAGDDTVHGDARIGASDYTLGSEVWDVGLAAALGTDQVTLNLDLGSWVVLDETQYQPSDLHIFVVSSNITIYEDWVTVSYPEAPLLVQFEHGAGQVLYTSFHNEPLTTQDLTDVLRYMVFEL